MPIPDPTVFLLVLARIAGLIGTAPVLGHAAVPLRIRAAVAGVLAIALTPAVPLPASLPTTLLGLGGAMAAESALGAVLGFVAQLVFAGVALGAHMAGVQMGFGFANLIDPTTRAQSSVVNVWQELLVLLVFLLLDVHHLLLRALVESFSVVSPGLGTVTAATAGGLLALGGQVFVIGLRIAAPVLIVLLLTNGVLGVLARTIPQLNVFVVGFPVNVGVGLIVLGAALPVTVRFLAGRFGDLEPTLSALVRGLVNG